MNASSVFISCMMILILFNFFYVTQFPESTWNLTIGAVIGLVATVLAIGIIGGINILGSGLSSASIKILFGVGTLLNILFQINIGGFPIGMGLASNVIACFNSAELLGIGYVIATSIGLLSLVSGLMIITGGAGGGE